MNQSVSLALACLPFTAVALSCLLLWSNAWKESVTCQSRQPPNLKTATIRRQSPGVILQFRLRLSQMTCDTLAPYFGCKA